MSCPLPWQQCTSTMTASITVHPANLAKHPQRWTKEEVGVWLQWCAEEYSIEPIQPEKFDLNGKALCLLSRNDFIERLPSNGDVLYNCLQTLISRHTGGGIVYQPPVPVTTCKPQSPVIDGRLDQTPVPTESLPAGLILLPTVTSTQSSLTSGPNFQGRSYVPIRPHPVFSGAMCDTSVLQSATKDCRLLWEFIYQLLINSKYREYVSWENRDDYVFRIVNPTGLAELWGQQKNRTNMTYEKLSRALRYYYRMNIIKKVPGKRLTYRFLQSPTRIQKGQRGAKPHCKYQLSSTVTSADQSLSSSERTNMETSSYWSNPREVRDSSSDINDDYDKDSSEEHDSKHSGLLDNVHSSKHFTSDYELLKVTADLSFQQFDDYSKYDTRAFFPIPVSCSTDSTLHSLQSSSSAFRPIHQRYDNPFTVQKIKVEKNECTLVPSFSAAPRVCSSTVITSTRTQDSTTITNSSLNYHSALTMQESLQRSLSVDCAQSMPVSVYPFRPNQTRSASPRTDIQLEPEDLSIRKNTIDT